jgi:hypothetical protein
MFNFDAAYEGDDEEISISVSGSSGTWSFSHTVDPVHDDGSSYDGEITQMWWLSRGCHIFSPQPSRPGMIF